VQLKIESHGRDHVNFFSIHPNRLGSPPVYRFACRIGENRSAFENFLQFDAAIFRYDDLKPHHALDTRAAGEFRIGGPRRIDKTLLEFTGILAQAAEESDFELSHPAFKPIASFFGLGSRAFHRQEFLVGHGSELRQFTETLRQAFLLFANERIPQGDLGIKELEVDVSGGRAELEKGTAAIQNGYGVQGARIAICGWIKRQVKSGIGFDVACATGFDRGFDVRREIARQENDDVSIARRKLRGAGKVHRAIFSWGIGIDPRGDSAAGGGGAHCACDARQADTARARFHFHRAGNIHDADAAAAGLGANRAAHLAEINLPAARADVDDASRFSDGDVAAIRVELGAAADLAGPNVSPAAAQHRIAGNISGDDVASSSESVQIARDIEHLDMATLCFQLCDPVANNNSPYSSKTNLSRVNIAALRDERRCAANVLSFDVAGKSADFDVVTRRNGEFKLHPELSAGSGAGGLGWKSSINFHAGRCGFGSKRIMIEKVLCQGSMSIGFEMHGIANDRRRSGLEGRDSYRAKIGRDAKSEAIPCLQNASAIRRSTS